MKGVGGLNGWRWIFILVGLLSREEPPRSTDTDMSTRL